MNKLVAGAVGAIALFGGTIGIINVARANSPEYQQKMNDELISEIINSVKDSDVCKVAERATKDKDVKLSDAYFAMSCLKLLNSQTEFITKIQSATSSKERKEYMKASRLEFVNSIRGINQSTEEL